LIAKTKLRSTGREEEEIKKSIEEPGPAKPKDEAEDEVKENSPNFPVNHPKSKKKEMTI